MIIIGTLLLSLSNSNIITQDDRKITYTECEMSLDSYKFTLIHPKQHVTSYFLIDLTKDYNVISSNHDENKCSNTRVQFEFLRYNNTLFNGVICISHPEISIRNHDLLNTLTLYLLTDERPPNGKFFMGFSAKVTDPNRSIVYMLYEKGTINHLSFAFLVSQPIQYSDITMYFGGVPKEVLSNKIKGSCKVNNSKLTWSCQLNNIIIGNVTNPLHVISNNDYSYFNTIHQEIYTPEWFFNETIENLYLKEPISKGACKIKIIEGITSYLCNYEVVNTLNDISFQFDDYVYNIDKHYLFDCRSYSNSCMLLLQKRSNIKDYWVIGITFMKNFDMEFDYEDQEVRLYTSNNSKFNSSIIKLPDTSHLNSILNINVISLIKKCIYMCILLLSIDVFIIIYTKHKLNIYY